MDLRPAVSKADYDTARELIQEYVRTPGVYICVGSLAEELRDLETYYSHVLLAFHDGAPAGCGALRPLGDGTAEMKRLYLRESLRGQGAGRAMAVALVETARQVGATAVRLDTLPQMQAAQRLYESLGFVRIAPYSSANPTEALCYELRFNA